METARRPAFTDVVTSEAALRALLGEPSELVVRKQLSALDQHCRAFIALAPFLTIATTSAAGACDVSPRGDAPGFVAVLDDRTLLIPERPGNRRFDTLRNIIDTGMVGLLFIIPGIEETLRVNGRACLVRDAAILEGLAARGKLPWLAIAVEVEECFLHCAKAFKRSRLWDQAAWPERAALPSLAQMLNDQVCLSSTSVEALEARIAESYTKNLY
jgi:PPOX class probable FMN-dependent enzyme